jgi:hypothetical protein
MRRVGRVSAITGNPESALRGNREGDQIEVTGHSRSIDRRPERRSEVRPFMSSERAMNPTG